MTDVELRHRQGVCPLHIGHGALTHPQLPGLAARRSVMIVTDSNVAATPWLDEVQRQLPQAVVHTLPPGEASKTLAGVETIWSALAVRGFGRDTLLLALGGGVVGDMAGFAAACWMRGIDYVQLPTTLLAQVDASVGGKTGIDLPAGKNLVGAFHQPRAVFIDTRTLQTLPEREYRSGLAEVVKVALLADPALLAWLEVNVRPLRERAPDALAHAIRRSCEIKAAIVEADEQEQGRRAWLNLGHTFGHALEQSTGYVEFLHGEAVAVGLVLALAASEQLLGLDAGLRPRLVTLLERLGLPVRLPRSVAPDALLEAMQLDKKHTAAGWRLVLLEAPGRPVVRQIERPDTLRDILLQEGSR